MPRSRSFSSSTNPITAHDMGSSGPLLASTVKRNFAIHHNRHEPVIFCVLELHDLTTAASQLSPSARFLRILLNGLVFVSFDCERRSSQVLPTRSADSTDFPSTLTAVLVINCAAIDFSVSSSIIGSRPA